MRFAVATLVLFWAMPAWAVTFTFEGSFEYWEVAEDNSSRQLITACTGAGQFDFTEPSSQLYDYNYNWDSYFTCDDGQHVGRASISNGDGDTEVLCSYTVWDCFYLNLETGVAIFQEDDIPTWADMKWTFTRVYRDGVQVYGPPAVPLPASSWLLLASVSFLACKRRLSAASRHVREA